MKYEEPKPGQKRVKTGFAIFPVFLDHGRDFIWLEQYRVVQRYNWHIGFWKNAYFLRDGEEL